MVFDAEQFVDECVAAAASSDPMAAVHEVVAVALVDPGAIDLALGTARTGGPAVLVSSPQLTIQRIQWPGGSEAFRTTIGCGPSSVSTKDEN